MSRFASDLPSTNAIPLGLDSRRLGLVALAVGLVVFAYGFSNTCAVGIVPMSLFGWLLKHWSRGGEYAHGYVVPLIAAGLFVWRARGADAPKEMNTARAGLWVILAAALVYWAGVRAANPRIVALSLVVLLFGLILYLAGWPWARRLWFPCVFLLFMIPLNFLEQYVAIPLRFFVAEVSTKLLLLCGLDVQLNGTGIHSLSGRFAPLDVANPCSGIRSLVALMALTALYGYLVMDRAWKKWAIFLSSIPLAIIGNLVRTTVVALVAQGFGSELAETIAHDYSGYIVFSLAIICMIALGVALNLHYRDLVHRWFHEEVAAPSPARPSASR
jgi:exosortase